MALVEVAKAVIGALGADRREALQAEAEPNKMAALKVGGGKALRAKAEISGLEVKAAEIPAPRAGAEARDRVQAVDVQVAAFGNSV